MPHVHQNLYFAQIYAIHFVKKSSKKLNMNAVDFQIIDQNGKMDIRNARSSEAQMCWKMHKLERETFDKKKFTSGRIWIHDLPIH